jgi:hypothetical protein
MSTLRLIVLALAAVPARGFYWDLPRYYSFYDLTPPTREADPSPHWRVSPDAYELKVRLPDLQPETVRATLGANGDKIEVVGERKIDGCSCSPSVVKEIAMPYRPRSEDIDVAYADKESVLSLRLTRHAKAESATPLAVSVKAEVKDKEEATTRPLRFVPHESATAEKSGSTLEAQEKDLAAKFRSAALAAVATSSGDGASAKEAAATAVEGAADAAATSATAEEGTNASGAPA